MTPYYHHQIVADSSYNASILILLQMANFLVFHGSKNHPRSYNMDGSSIGVSSLLPMKPVHHFVLTFFVNIGTPPSKYVNENVNKKCSHKLVHWFRGQQTAYPDTTW